MIARSTLWHYINMACSASGIRLDSDCRLEIEDIVDEIVDEAVREAKRETLKEVRKILKMKNFLQEGGQL